MYMYVHICMLISQTQNLGDESFGLAIPRRVFHEVHDICVYHIHVYIYMCIHIHIYVYPDLRGRTLETRASASPFRGGSSMRSTIR